MIVPRIETPRPCCMWSLDPIFAAITCYSLYVWFYSNNNKKKNKNAGRVQRHAWLNDLIHHALIRAEIPPVREPSVLSRDDGKRPDGLTLVAWHSGRSATWDVTVIQSIHWLRLTCHKVWYRQEVHRQRLQRENQPSTAVCHLAMSFVQWLLRRLIRWRMMRNFSWQRLVGEQHFAQPIRGNACFYISGFLRQFSVSMLYVWPTRWLFLSPHRNHSRHRSTLC